MTWGLVLFAVVLVAFLWWVSEGFDKRPRVDRRS